MIKKLLIITAMLIAIGGCSSTIEKIEDWEDRYKIQNAAMGCDLTYAEAEALDVNEANLCRKKLKLIRGKEIRTTEYRSSKLPVQSSINP